MKDDPGNAKVAEWIAVATRDRWGVCGLSRGALEHLLMKSIAR